MDEPTINGFMERMEEQLKVQDENFENYQGSQTKISAKSNKKISSTSKWQVY